MESLFGEVKREASRVKAERDELDRTVIRLEERLRVAQEVPRKAYPGGIPGFAF